MYLLHCTFNQARARFPVSQRRVILWLLKQCGTPDVPSLRAYQELDELLRKQCAVPTVRHKSDMRNIFYSNSIVELICKVSTVV